MDTPELERMRIFGQHFQLEVQHVVFAAAAKVVGGDLGARLGAEAAAARRAAGELAPRHGAAQGAPALIVRGGSGGWMLTFAGVPESHQFAGLPFGGAAAGDALKWMNMVLGRARGTWAHWAEEHGARETMEFDAARGALALGGRVCLGFAVAEVPEA